MLNTVQKNSFQQFNFKSDKFHNNNTSEKNTKIKASIGAALGTILPVTVMMKKREIKNPLKLEYGLKDMIVLSGTSVSGGTLGGMINTTKESKNNKFKEGTFQFLNAVLPTVTVAGGLKFCEKEKQLNHTPVKLLTLGLGIISGMLAALKLSNYIFDPKDEQPDRKLSPKDCLASADEAVGALALAKFPIVKSLNLDKSLPVIYGYCGYRAGNAT